ncbi:hypothetical protein SEUCBS140593_003589 [Sporothrix eucalyptigena]|uniref:Uncharacterized protein n=1 Tax=Sporothrix eucalyptigena TaxID=1812306 RepID=A0ABP0BH61_9PEZI
MAHRAPIVNPPSQAIPQPPPPRREPPIVDPRGGIEHPSPGRNYHQENPKVWDDYMRLTFAIEQCLSDSVRCAVRQNWEKCLLGTSFHQGFLLNAMLDKVSPDIARGSMRDFGAKIVKNTKAEIITHMSSADIDEVTNAILSIASDRFLDAALEMRLRTIDAKPLINALARAERLGYEPGDIIEEPMGGQERVIPQDVPVSQQPLPPPPPALAQPATKQCNICSRLFEDEPPYVYHVANKVCFENTYGLQYHNSTNACKKYVSPKPAVAAKATLSTAPAPAPTSAQATRAYVPYKAPSQLPPAPLPPARSPHVLPATRPTATPTRPEASQPLPPSSSQPERSQTPTIDPYAHLSEEKLASLNNELLRCEQIFTDRFREAEDIADPVERRTKLDNLKNSFGTRQSIIRKKYGVRLRERRTKAELQAERVRMGLDGKMSSAYSSPTGGRSGHYATTPTSSQPIDGTAYAVKRVRTENGTPSGRRSESESRESPDSTHRRRKTPTPGKAPPMAETLRAQRLPQPADDDDDNMSDSSSDNDDIPARLPDSVRQSLSASQR